jgi:tRNA-dihydrouridine synthase
VVCVGNGDVRSREQGEEYARRFGVDGVMIGRGVFALTGNVSER